MRQCAKKSARSLRALIKSSQQDGSVKYDRRWINVWMGSNFGQASYIIQFLQRTGKKKDS